MGVDGGEGEERAAGRLREEREGPRPAGPRPPRPAEGWGRGGVWEEGERMCWRMAERWLADLVAGGGRERARAKGSAGAALGEGVLGEEGGDGGGEARR
jgi:hypothetical protein